MKTKKISLAILIFTMCLYSVAAANMYNYVYNGSSWVPALSTADGQQKYWINMANASYGEVQYNLTVAEKVGIGTTSPNQELTVIGNANITGDLYVNDSAIYLGNVSLSNINGVLVWGNISIGNPVDTNAVVAFHQSTCPLGWTLADGSNGTPDLRGIFIRGAGTHGTMTMANGTNFSATYGEYYNDSFQGHWHKTQNGGIDTSAGGASYVTYGPGPNEYGDSALMSGGYVADTTYGLGAPRYGAETSPASYALIYCVKTAEDSDASNSIWQKIAGVISPTNSTEFVKIITSDTQKSGDYSINTNDRSGLIVLNFSTTSDSTFTLPSGNDGDIYRIQNDADYVLTINVSDNSNIWNSGNGYGIDLPDKGTYVELRYSSARGKWDILQKTGGKVLIEGLALAELMDEMGKYNAGGSLSAKTDDSNKHRANIAGNVVSTEDVSSAKFPPSAYVFDGTGDYMKYGDSTDWDIFGTNTSVGGHKTVAFWVYFDNSGASETIISNYQNADNRWYLQRQSDNTFKLYYASGGSSQIDISGGWIFDTVWTHMALVINNSDVGIYVNGNQVAYDGSWDTDTFSGSFYIGQDGANGGYLEGRMQDLHISYNNPYNANPNSGNTDSFTVPASSFMGVME